MRTLALTSMLAVLTAMAIPAAKMYAGDKDSGLSKLITEADAIAAVKILSTDYTATASDGPMYAKAKVLKVLKGNVSTWWKLRFGETGWWGPTYKKGERRIVFLGRRGRKDKYFKAKWHTIYTGGLDFFFAEDSLDSISLKSLSDFLKTTQDLKDTGPKVKFGVAKKDATTKMLSIKIINEGDKAFWLNPSRITVSFKANRIRHRLEMNWVDYEKNTWRKIEPASSITGSVYINDEQIKEVNEIKVMLSHLSVCFPYRCWTGFESANVSVKD